MNPSCRSSGTKKEHHTQNRQTFGAGTSTAQASEPLGSRLPSPRGRLKPRRSHGCSTTPPISPCPPRGRRREPETSDPVFGHQTHTWEPAAALLRSCFSKRREASGTRPPQKRHRGASEGAGLGVRGTRGTHRPPPKELKRPRTLQPGTARGDRREVYNSQAV